MQDLNKYISGLLFIHDCVILPGFGGFVSNYHQAEHNVESNTFFPPKKDVLFNRSLTYNDGLLINYLAKNYNLSYEEAEERIKTEVQEAWLRLDKGEEVFFTGVGTFFYDKNEKLNFKPADTENYLTDSYGLNSFRFPPLAYQNNTIDFVANHNQPSDMNSGLKQTLKWVAIAIPIVGVLSLIPYYKSHKQQSAGIVTSVTVNNSKKTEVSAMPVDTNIHGVIDQVTDKRTALFYTQEPEVPAKKQEVSSSNFYLIGGSYKAEGNAKEQCNIFIDQGYSAEVIHVDAFYRVSLAKFDSKVNALHELRRIRSEDQNDKIWLFAK